jgi:hypothetical protein
MFMAGPPEGDLPLDVQAAPILRGNDGRSGLDYTDAPGKVLTMNDLDRRVSVAPIDLGPDFEVGLELD